MVTFALDFAEHDREQHASRKAFQIYLDDAANKRSFAPIINRNWLSVAGKPREFLTVRAE